MVWPSDLGSLQRRFLALITAPEGVPGSLERLGASVEELAAVVVADDRLDPLGRLGVYADMYLERLIDVVRDDYPKMAVVLGDETFVDVARDFLTAMPPDGFSLRDLGAPLAGFLAGHRLTVERPWLPDLAGLEWSRADVFDLEDCDVMTFDQLRSLAPERFAELPLRLIPAQRRCRVTFPVDEIWRQIERGNCMPPVTNEAPGVLLAWRRAGEVLHRRVDPVEADLLDLLAAGTTFGQMCERLGTDRTVEEAAALAFPLLTRWSAEALLRHPDRLK